MGIRIWPRPRNLHFIVLSSATLLVPGLRSLADDPGRSGSIRLGRIEAAALAANPNLVPNPGFEEAGPDGLPTGWIWDRRNTDATCRIDAKVAHRGGHSLRFTNGTEFGPHIYGSLWSRAPVALRPDRDYTLSAWVKSSAPGILSIMGGARWQYRASASPAGDGWQRIAVTFRPEKDDLGFTPRINTESPSAAVWVDDLKLEEGREPTPDPPPAGTASRASLEADAAPGAVRGDGPFRVDFTAWLPRDLDGTSEIHMDTGEAVSVPLRLRRGFHRLVAEGRAAGVDDTPRTLTLRLRGAGGVSAEAQTRVAFCSPRNLESRVDALKRDLPALRQALDAVKARGQDPSAALVGLTVLENFPGYVADDLRHGEIPRALNEVRELEAIAVRLRAELAECLDGKRVLPNVPRWTGAERPVVEHGSFLAPVRWPTGSQSRGPVFFTGFGHFGRVVDDMEKWPSYGTNIIQIEVGPMAVFSSEGVTDTGPVEALRRTLDRAQKSGVAVCLLISPHYLPGWAVAKWPALRRHREGFLQYCLHAPEGQELLKRFVAVLVEPIRDHPALHSICLSNEPVNKEEPCERARAEWRGWLEARHGTIDRMNERYGTHATRWEDVPLPDPFGSPAPGPIALDFVRFNQEFFARWHGMLADAVHRVAPTLPVHAKAMNWTMLNDGDVGLGVDATLFGRFSGINGNDAVNFYGFGLGEFAQGWEGNAMGHDLQRSVLDAPVFNTENHILEDRNTRPVPADHVRAALWQAAVHGQGATTIWVWDRTFDPKGDFSGSILERPACVEAVGLVSCDLNRLAPEVTALQRARPDVLLVQSTSSLVWEGPRHTACRGALYEALAFAGLKAGFITERQLEAGVVPDAPLVLAPDVVHLSDAARESLAKCRGRLVPVGGPDVLSRDEYDRPRPPITIADRLPWTYAGTKARELAATLWHRLPAWGVSPSVAVRTESGEHPWGVAWRRADTQEGILINVCNYMKELVTVRVVREGRAVRAKDLMAAKEAGLSVTLKPLQPRLLRIEGDPGR
ncbi:beta-galactosidase [Aquisphaera insulae]|uniref:beta-galactosidase n=1 Tax=Aquisphaera insulae TaxID=2712864 RepID=UPI0013EBDF3E|nr:beta-galactosidase [Aquisphaera insulae]